MTDSIFRPHYNIAATIDSVLNDLDRQRWLVESMLLMPKHEVWLRRNVSVRRAAGTTRIEGAGMDEAAVTSLLRDSRPGRLSDDERANVNAMRAYEFVDFVSDQPDVPIDELVIRQLDRDFIAGGAATLTPGIYRTGQNRVRGFTPPHDGDVPSLMRSFALWLREEQAIHPVIKAGLAHIHVVAVHPFWDGNGRTARAVATLLLQRSEFGFRKLLSLEENLFDDRDKYFDAIEKTLGTSFKSDYDATPWLEFFAGSVHTNAYKLVASLTEWHRHMEEGHRRMEKAGLPSRLADGIAYAGRMGVVTRRDYMEITDVSPITASRDLSKLVEMGFLVAEGKTRSRVYRTLENAAESKQAPAGEQLTFV